MNSITHGPSEAHSRRRRRALPATIAAALLLAGVSPFLPSPAEGRRFCPDGSPPPCDIPEPEPEPDPDPPPPEPPDEPAPPPPPDPECDAPGGFPRPAGAVPPGYVYSPTGFDGVAADPQPDDTFAADAPGHAVHVGRLRTRVANGREEFLVCAHVGTNAPVAALTPFPVAGPGAHPATIAPRVVVIDAVGGTTSYDLGAPGVTGSLSRYAGSTDPREGFVQMWVPFTYAMREPGFTVRVEIRGTPALAGGGSTLVMGADEVFVHLGQQPQHMSGTVWQSLGLALDDGAIAERPGDPGADDLSSYFGPVATPLIEQTMEALAPREFDEGRLNTLDWWSSGHPTLNLVDVGAQVAHLQVHLHGIATIQATVHPREWGIVAGSCEVSAALPIDATATVSLGLVPDRTRPRVILHDLTATVGVNYLTASGEVWAVWDPFPLSCHNAIEDSIEDRMLERVSEMVDGLRDSSQVRNALAAIHQQFDLVDLWRGPFSMAHVDLPSGLGFTLQGGRYVPTGPGGPNGEIGIWSQGADLVAEFVAWGQGGSRFVYSVVPRSSSSVVARTHDRVRRNGQDFDLGVVVNGATVNQVLRALTSGKPQSIVAPPGDVLEQVAFGPLAQTVDVGLLDLYEQVDVDGNGTLDLDVQVHPAVSPMYLPSPPFGWPADGTVDVFVPSLRISIPAIAQVATMATDVRVGLDAFVDAQRVVPYVQVTHVVPRFLRLGSSINQMLDPAADPTGIVVVATDEIRQAVPSRVSSVLKAVNVPDLSVLGGPQVFLRDLSVQTVGDGHLGVYVDVATSPPAGSSPVSVAWAGGGANGEPVSVTATVGATAIPGVGPYTVAWTISDASTNAVLYQSPSGGEQGDAAMSKTVGASEFAVATDACSGDHHVGVRFTVAISRGGYTKTVSDGRGHWWAGTPPNPVPDGCYEPEPEPEPEPDPDPPICLRQPWKCPDDF